MIQNWVMSHSEKKCQIHELLERDGMCPKIRTVSNFFPD